MARSGRRDLLEHSIHVLHDFVIPESHKTVSLRLKPLGTCLVAIRLIRLGVHIAVEFDNESQLVTVEVDNETADGPLATEFPIELSVSQALPQQAHSRRQRMTQLTGSGADGAQALGVRDGRTLPPHPTPSRAAAGPSLRSATTRRG